MSEDISNNPQAIALAVKNEVLRNDIERAKKESDSWRVMAYDISMALRISNEDALRLTEENKAMVAEIAQLEECGTVDFWDIVFGTMAGISVFGMMVLICHLIFTALS